MHGGHAYVFHVSGGVQGAKLYHRHGTRDNHFYTAIHYYAAVHNCNSTSVVVELCMELCSCKVALRAEGVVELTAHASCD